MHEHLKLQATRPPCTSQQQSCCEPQVRLQMFGMTNSGAVTQALLSEKSVRAGFLQIWAG